MSDDTISRQAAIDGLSKLRPRMIDTYEKDGDVFLKVRACDVNDMLKELPPAEPHWIPVAERLPEESGCYLVSVKNDHERRYSKTAWFEKGTWLARQDVIAWMPLPEPYEGRTE